MTSKLSYISSWQFVFWDNERYRYLVSLQSKYIDVCMFTSWGIVWHHASQTAKYLFSSNLRWISFIKPSLNLPFSHLYRLLSESWSVSSRIPLQFKSSFCSHHNGGIIKKKCEFKTILWSLCYPRLRDDNSTCILCKNIENELRVYLSRRVAF